MGNISSMVFAGIAPHPPIMVPEVGGEAIADVRSSIDAMADLTSRVIRSGAETVVLISPHAPLEREAFVAYESPELYGDFGDFRAPATAVRADLDQELLNEITHAASSHSLSIARIRGYELDHGILVPLYFLQRNGWQGRVVALGYSFLSNEQHIGFGKCITQAVNAVGRPSALIASGDLSHRLQPNAPAGYEPEAHRFDEKVVAAIRHSSTGEIVDIDQNLRRLAGECGYRSMLVAIGVMHGLESQCEVISYEAPFGVGYLVAQLLASGNPSGRRDQPEQIGAELLSLARATVETLVRHGTILQPPATTAELLKQRVACFVSVKTMAGDLRGCIGTIEPAKDTLVEELIANAVNAATRDPRFRPIAESELSKLKYSVDVLSAPEPAELQDLDPGVYGVIVEDESGVLRGLLLPNLHGIDTAEKQVEIAARKAGIRPGTPIKLFRFRAERYREDW